MLRRRHGRWLALVLSVAALMRTEGESREGGFQPSSGWRDWGLTREEGMPAYSRGRRRSEVAVASDVEVLRRVRGGAWGLGRDKKSALWGAKGNGGQDPKAEGSGKPGAKEEVRWSSQGSQMDGRTPVAPQLAVEEDEETEMGAIVIGPDTASRSVTEESAVEEEVEDQGEVREFSPYGSGDDDDDNSEWDEDRKDHGASYLQEIEGEDEPEWVAAYAAGNLDDVAGVASDEGGEKAQAKYSREEANALLRRLWARSALGRAEMGAEGEEGEEEVDNPFKRPSKVAARRMLYRAFAKDLASDSRTMGGRHWLDKDALVHLRGQALLCQHPEYAALLAGLNVLNRGLRPVVPGATHMVHEVLAAALAHSVRGRLLVADHRRVAAIRRIALEHGVPKAFLSTDDVVGALLALVRDAGTAAQEGQDPTEPYVVFLADRARYFVKSKNVTEALLAELRSRTSRTLFLLSPDYDPDSPLEPPPEAPSPPSATQFSPGQAPISFSVGNPWGLVAAMDPERHRRACEWEAERRALEWQPNMTQPGLDPMALPRPGLPLPPLPPGFKGGPMLHLVIRPHVGPLPPGMGNPNMNMQGMHPGQAPNGSIPTPHDLRRLIGDLAERFSQMAKDRMDVPPLGRGEEGAKDGDEDEEEDEEMEELAQRQNREALTQLSAMLDQLSKNTEITKQIEEHLQRSMRDMPPMPPQADGQPSNQPPVLPQVLITLVASPPPPGPHVPGAPALPQQPQPPRMPPPPAAPAMNGASASGAKSGRSWKPFEMFNQRPKEGGSEGAGGRKKKGRAAAARDGAPSAPHLDQSPSADELTQLFFNFEDVKLTVTKDASLRAKWNRVVREDIERHNARRNFRVLQAALRDYSLVCPELTRTHPLLAKVQLTRSYPTTAKEGGTAGAQYVSNVILSAVEVDVSTRPTLPRVETEEGPRVALSLPALETALAMVCKTNIQRPGVPVSRTKEEVTALAQNRHEQALVSNVISPADIGVTYAMIGGLNDVKETLRQCVTYPLKFPHLYSEGIAADSVKGVLLFGPPGTGKTMLAKAVATEGGATFLSVDASVIESKWLGESEKNAKAVFTLARRLAPCVIYLDEVDSILSSRDQGEDTKYNTITSVKTTFMQEWDGLRTTADRVIVVASTNRPYALDQAVLRRMPRRILVDLPDLETREEMLRVMMSSNRVSPDVNMTAIARRLEGYTGSDIREVCREAVVRIAHDESKKLETEAQGGVGLEALSNHRLRPVTSEDFAAAMEKLSASVAAKGRELERVREWNNQFGEVRKKQRPPHLSMYL